MSYSAFRVLLCSLDFRLFRVFQALYEPTNRTFFVPELRLFYIPAAFQASNPARTAHPVEFESVLGGRPLRSTGHYSLYWAESRSAALLFARKVRCLWATCTRRLFGACARSRVSCAELLEREERPVRVDPQQEFSHRLVAAC